MRPLNCTLGDMSYAYRITLNEPYCRTMIRRFHEQQPVLLRPEWQFGTMAVALPFVSLLLPFESDRIVVFLLMVPVCTLLAIAGLAVTRVVTYQNFRYSPYFGGTSVCLVSEDGLRLSGAWHDELVGWSTIRWVVRHPDGLLILRRAWVHRDWVQLQPRRLCWLPDSALEGGSPHDVTGLVSDKNVLRRVA